MNKGTLEHDMHYVEIWLFQPKYSNIIMNSSYNWDFIPEVPYPEND